MRFYVLIILIHKAGTLQKGIPVRPKGSLVRFLWYQNFENANKLDQLNNTGYIRLVPSRDTCKTVRSIMRFFVLIILIPKAGTLQWGYR